MGSNNLKLVLAASLIAGSNFMFAQTGTDLGPQSVEVKGDYAPIITEAHKIVDLPVLDDSIPPAPKLTYTILSKQVPVDFQLEPIQPATMKGEPLVKLYNHLAKVGLGNYNTPYAEYWYNMRRSKKMLLAANAGHLSSSAKIRDYGEAKNSTNHVSGFSKFFLDKNVIDAGLGYKRDRYNVYGFNKDYLPLLNLTADALNFAPRIYDLAEAKVSAISLVKDSASLNHHEKVGYYYFGDNSGSKENAIHVNGGVSKYINSELFGADVDFRYFNYSTLFGTRDNFILAFNPYVSMQKPKIVARLGARVGLENDSASSTYFYPDVKAEYRAVEEVFTIYGELTGGPVRNSYRSIAEENPFVSNFLDLRNTRERFGAGVGLKGLIGSDITYNAFAKYSHVEDMYFFSFFKNDLFQHYFDVIYDDVDEVKVHADLAYRAAEKITVTVKGDYFRYSMTKEDRAWYRPDYTVGVGARYNLESKIIVTADLFFIGSRYGKTYEIDDKGSILQSEEKLKGYADLNLGAEYRYSKRLGMFLNLNNLAGARYFRYVNYPVYRLNLLAGVSYSF